MQTRAATFQQFFDTDETVIAAQTSLKYTDRPCWMHIYRMWLIHKLVIKAGIGLTLIIHCNTLSNDVIYRHGGNKLIVDKMTFTEKLIWLEKAAWNLYRTLHVTM